MANLLKGRGNMEKYNKPSMNYVELRIEESLAGFGSLGSSVAVIRGNDNSKFDHTFSDNWINVWLKILRG